MLFISHALGDVHRNCDRVVVLRDGEVVGQGPTGGFDLPRMVALMVGRELRQLYPTRARWQADGSAVADAAREPLLEVCGLSEPGVARDVSFTLHRGEVLGIAGLMGAGRTELARLIFGLEQHHAGTIRLEGTPLHGPSRRRIAHGLALLTESRREDGLCLEASIADNMALVTLRERASAPFGLVRHGALRKALGDVARAVQLPADLQTGRAVKTLSGGNQQKVVLAKWLLAGPRVMILDEPTRGIDVGAKYEIHRLVHEVADRGAGVLVISSEIDELIGICDRILVMCQGRLTNDLPRAAFDRARILLAALPA
jgi:ribose transport system ATP-binding protein